MKKNFRLKIIARLSVLGFLLFVGLNTNCFAEDNAKNLGAAKFLIPLDQRVVDQMPDTPTSRNGTFSDPVEIPANELSRDIRVVRDSTSVFGLGPAIRIEGTKRYDSFVLTAETITFARGAKLVFTERAWQQRSTLLVATRRIINEDQSRPGAITWYRRSSASSGPNTPGQGTPGRNGSANSGENGGRGGVGGRGITGGQGTQAPSLIVFVPNPPTPGALILDFSGQNGGTGGLGQKGGRGGDGGSGRPASTGPFDCQTGAGDGGDGGNGGVGGTGGKGGRGGRGNAVTVVALVGQLGNISRRVRVQVSGGDGGQGGQGGQGGNSGSGGPGGAKDLPFCTTRGSRGSSGSGGQRGRNGRSGAQAQSGDFFVSELTSGQFKAVFSDD